MESELEQFTNRCRVLSREVALQEREKVALQHEVEDLKAELDTLSRENLLLRSRYFNDLHHERQVRRLQTTVPKRGRFDEKELIPESSDRLMGELQAKLDKATKELEVEKKERSLLSRIFASSQPL
jgi:hypothetical protein